MTKKQAIKKSIEHWERMIEWVKTRPELDVPRFSIMELQINEDWFFENCSLCEEYYSQYDSCSKCPLSQKDQYCGHKHSYWDQLDRASTWKTWLLYAKKLLKVLKTL